VVERHLAVKCVVIMIIRRPEKLMSKPVTSTLDGKKQVQFPVFSPPMRKASGPRIPGVERLPQRSAFARLAAQPSQVPRTPCRPRRTRPERWPHHSWREIHQSWMLFIHWCGVHRSGTKVTAPLDRVNRFQAMDLLVGTGPGPCSRHKPLVGQHRR
jgi:hypothetical protein